MQCKLAVFSNRVETQCVTAVLQEISYLYILLKVAQSNQIGITHQIIILIMTFFLTSRFQFLSGDYNLGIAAQTQGTGHNPG